MNQRTKHSNDTSIKPQSPVGASSEEAIETLTKPARNMPPKEAAEPQRQQVDRDDSLCDHLGLPDFSNFR